MKKIVIYIYEIIPLKRELYQLIKILFIPPDNIRKYLRFKSKFKVKLQNKNSFYLYQNNFPVERKLFWEGINGYEKTTLQLWSELSKVSNNIFDVGANTGLFSILAKSVNPDSNIHSFEPLLRIFNLLNKNIYANKYKINTYKLAISNKTGETTLYDYTDVKDATTASLNINFRPINQIPVQVKTITLDDFVDKHKIQSIDLLKVDVETLEPEVLKGFQKYVKDFKPYIFIEVLNYRVASELNKVIDKSTYLIYHINELKGLYKKFDFEAYPVNRNYLLCPKEKHITNKIIEKYIIK